MSNILSEFWRMIHSQKSEGGYSYPVHDPKNLHDHIESISDETVIYQGSSESVTSNIVVDEGPSVVVNDKRDGWLRLWK